MQVVRDRLSTELEIIISKGMCDYLLIVYDFIDWAKKQGIPMGPGRGSGAGSIILYLIGITDIEPLRFNLFFERFINPERLSYPDIDVDICMDRRSGGDRLYGPQVWERKGRADHHLWNDESEDGDQRCRPGAEHSACQSERDRKTRSRRIEYHLRQSA